MLDVAMILQPKEPTVDLLTLYPQELTKLPDGGDHDVAVITMDGRGKAIEEIGKDLIRPMRLLLSGGSRYSHTDSTPGLEAIASEGGCLVIITPAGVIIEDPFYRLSIYTGSTGESFCHDVFRYWDLARCCRVAMLDAFKGQSSHDNLSKMVAG